MSELMTKSNFFALLARLRYIQRWGLMRNTVAENVQDHSAQVAMVAHALALMAKHQFGKDLDANSIGMLALYHDADEVYTGDIPTPVKKADSQSAQVHERIGQVARDALLKQLPQRWQPHYSAVLNPDKDSYAYKLVKAADKICAYFKCIEETKAGNSEFAQASRQIEQDLDIMAAAMPEVAIFRQIYLEAFQLSLDELHAPASASN